MVSFPIRRSRRYRLVKFVYTADNGQKFIQGQFNYLDDQGNVFIDLAPSIIDVEVNQPKEKIWSDTSNLRRCDVRYQDDNNSNGFGTAKFYIPNRFPDIALHLTEIRDILKAKFNAFNLHWCTDYQGENRFTEDLPIDINEVIE